MTNLSSISIEDEMRGDVFSYAVIVWQMITRKTPWANCELFFFIFFFHFVLNTFEQIFKFQIRIIFFLLVKDSTDIEFQVRSGKREEIPDPKGDKNLEILTSLIELCWSQNPDKRPPFKQIAQRLLAAIN